jgi:hypothetical protein
VGQAQRIGQEHRDADQRHGHRGQQEDDAGAQEDGRQDRAAEALLGVGRGELDLQFGQAGDVAAQLGEVAEDPLGQGGVDPHPPAVGRPHRRLINHPRSTPMPSARPRARAGCSTV